MPDTATRRTSREWAVQLLFQLDLNATDKLDVVFSDFWKAREAEPRARRFAESLVRGVREHQSDIDARIRGAAEHWAVERMGVLDRNVIRLCVYELLYRSDIPAAVSINEAVDLAKYFSSRESGRFVNGILDRIRNELGRDSRRATPTREGG
jgi:N utilization substance protein B